MAMSDTISDMLTTIRNGQSVRLATVSTPSSNVRKGILDVLVRDGYIKGYEEVEVRKGVKQLNITLRYHKGQPVIKRIRRVSKPGLRQYASVENLPKVFSGLGIAILSTSKGIMADHEAREAGVGGEVICNVF